MSGDVQPSPGFGAGAQPPCGRELGTGSGEGAQRSWGGAEPPCGWELGTESGEGPQRRWGGAEPLPAGRASARMGPAQQGWGPDGFAGGAGAQPPC